MINTGVYRLIQYRNILEKNQYFSGLNVAYLFFLITFILNIWVIYYGIKGGIERLCKWAMPLLFIFALMLMLRVITLGTPDLSRPNWNVANGFGFLWNPDFSALKSAKVWLEAAGQIFFTLSARRLPQARHTSYQYAYCS